MSAIVVSPITAQWDVPPGGGDAIEGVTLQMTLFHVVSISQPSLHSGTGVVVVTPGVVDDLVRSLWGGGLLSIAVPYVGGEGKVGVRVAEVACPGKQRGANGGTFVLSGFGIAGVTFSRGRGPVFCVFGYWISLFVSRLLSLRCVGGREAVVDGRRIVLYRSLRDDLGHTVSGYPRSHLFVLASSRARHLYLSRLTNLSVLGSTIRVAVKTRSMRGALRALTSI